LPFLALYFLSPCAKIVYPVPQQRPWTQIQVLGSRSAPSKRSTSRPAERRSVSRSASRSASLYASSHPETTVPSSYVGTAFYGTRDIAPCAPASAPLCCNPASNIAGSAGAIKLATTLYLSNLQICIVRTAEIQLVM
jgi:hypothetical protein